MEAINNFIATVLKRSNESPVQTLLFASAVALAGVGVASYSGLFSFSSSNSNENLAPALTEEEARKVMKTIIERLHTTLPKLFRFAEQIKQQIAAQGQEIDDATLLKIFILPSLESAFREIQDGVLEEFDVDEDELEEAVTEYMKQGDTELMQISTSIRSIFKKFGANIVDEDDDEEEEDGGGGGGADSSKSATTNPAIGAPSTAAGNSKKKAKSSKDLSLEEFLKFFRTFQKIQMDATKTALEDFVEEFGNKLNQNTMGIFQQRILLATQEVQQEVFEAHNMDPETLERLLTKYQTNTTLQQIVQEMEHLTMQIINSLGITGLDGTSSF